MKRLILLLLLFTGPIANAQQTFIVGGTVSDDKGITLPGATVFLTNTKHITVSDNSGKFGFINLEGGTYELVIKMIGFKAFIEKITLGSKPVVINAVLKDDNVQLNEVTISVADPNRPKYLALFTKYFIGESTNASQCRLLNPEVIKFHFDKNTGVLSAHTDKLLAIENQGLGYKLNYLVTDFKFDRQNLAMSYTGYPYFEELRGTPAQQKRWDAARITAYAGSMNHFFKAAYNNTAEAESFVLYTLTDNIARMKLPDVGATPTGEVFEPASNNLRVLKPFYSRHSPQDTTALFVFCKGGAEPFSFIKSGMYVSPPVKVAGKGHWAKLEPLTDCIQIDKNGRVNPAQGFLVSGYWAWTKIAELVPIDFKLNKETAALATVAEPVVSAIDKKIIETTTRFTKHGINNQTEHIYLHLNKPWYNRTDTIWFRAYTLKGDDHTLSDKSGIAYAELVSPKDSIVQRLNLKLLSGMASGDFALPFSLVPGTYRVRAYTNLMRNNGEDSFYDRQIVIGNPLSAVVNLPSPKKKTEKPANANTNASATLKNTQPDIQFFPEGGDLVNGLRSVVAFKAVNPDGSPAAITGFVIASDGSTAADMETTHTGMGAFAFIPQKGITYTAKVQFADGNKQTINLPAALDEGYVLTVNNQEADTLRIKLNSKNPALPDFYLVARTGGKVVYTTAGKADNKPLGIRIAKDRFPTGIATLTLFTESGEPVNERLVFIKQPDNLELAVKTDNLSYAATGNVNLNLSAAFARQPVMGSFSAAVINEDKTPVDEDAETTIFSQLLLSSELHGRISDPGYYFKDQQEQTQKNLDLLMLTQGYRKLEWKQQLDTLKQVLKYPAEDGLTISGSVTTTGGKPVNKAKVSVSFPFLHLAADTLTDANGHFAVQDLDITGNAQVIVKATPPGGQVKLITDAPLNLATPLPVFAAVNTFAALQKGYLAEEQRYQKLKGIQLKEVTVKEKYKKYEPDLSTSTNLNGPGHADQVVMGNNLGDCAFLSNCLIGKIQSIKVTDSGAIINEARGELMDWNSHKVIPMSICLNGALIGSINDINPKDVYSIEVLTSVKYKSIYGHNAAGGMLLITTKNGIPDYDRIPDAKALNINKYVFNGFYKARSFYTPKYEAANLTGQPSAIYWKPDILTDKDGKCSLQYNNAGKGNYRVVVEGIDGEGRLGRAVYRYKVE